MYKKTTPITGGWVRSVAGEPFPTASSSHCHRCGNYSCQHWHL